MSLKYAPLHAGLRQLGARHRHQAVRVPQDRGKRETGILLPNNQRQHSFFGWIRSPLPTDRGYETRVCVPQDRGNEFTEMCSGSEAGSYLRRIDFVYHSTLGLRVIKKKKKKKVTKPGYVSRETEVTSQSRLDGDKPVTTGWWQASHDWMQASHERGPALENPYTLTSKPTTVNPNP